MYIHCDVILTLRCFLDLTTFLSRKNFPEVNNHPGTYASCQNTQIVLNRVIDFRLVFKVFLKTYKKQRAVLKCRLFLHQKPHLMLNLLRLF